MREKSDNQIYWYLFIAIVLPISFIGLGVDIYYPYRLKPYWLKSTFLLLIALPLLVIDIHILITKIKQKKKYFPRITLIVSWVLLIYLIINLFAITLLVYSKQMETTHTFVFNKYLLSDYKTYPGGRYGLAFSQTQINDIPKIDLPIDVNIGDCLNIQYRQNIAMIEIRLIENLGKMSKEQCLLNQNLSK